MVSSDQHEASDDTAAFVENVQKWLEDPEIHLRKKSRKEVLEMIVVEHVEKIKRAERLRTRGKDLIMVAAVATILSPFVPRILAIFGASWQ